MAQFFVLSLLYMAVLYRVDGGMSISPPVPAMGAVGDTVLKCDSSGLQFVSINSLQISRKRATETKFTLLASIFRTDAAPGIITPLVPFLNKDTDLSTRDGINFLGSGIQTDTSLVSSLQVNIPQVNLLCTDEAEYQCTFSYVRTTLNTELNLSYANMTIFVPPKDLTLTVTHNGVVPGEGLQSNPTQFSVGDVIQLSCSGSIGSNSNQEFKWQRTPLSGSPPFNPYNPAAGTENKGTVPSSAVSCMYSRTATLSYNISKEDGNRDHVWRFKCVAEYGTETPKQTQESSTYFIRSPGGNQNPNRPPGTGAVSAAGSGGMIAGIVVGVVAVLVLVVLLVYFLWYRKRGGAGDTYRTKEEQGSSNPNLTDPDMYATVDKNKSKGHENKAMDEKHESRSKRNRDNNDYPRSYDNGRKNDYGNRNYALDRDEDDDFHSRDGSPTVHMSGGPIGTGV